MQQKQQYSHSSRGLGDGGNGMSPAAVAVCELIAEKLLKEASSAFTLLGVSSSMSAREDSNKRGGINMDFVEAAVWLLRSAGLHERAIDVLQEHMTNPSIRNKSSLSSGMVVGSTSFDSTSSEKRSGRAGIVGGGWPQIKYESYMAAHLSELLSSNSESCFQLVIHSSATKHLLEYNPKLGLNVFTASHPQNKKDWDELVAQDDPLMGGGKMMKNYPMKIVKLLESVNPATKETMTLPSSPIRASFRSAATTTSLSSMKDVPLPLDSGRALAISYIESAIGLSTHRPLAPPNDPFDSLDADREFEERVADMHDELSYLLLEGIIAERGDDDDPIEEEDDSKSSGGGTAHTELGMLYQMKLRRFLSWPNAKIRSERLLGSLPSSFLREQSLLLGRLGRHEDALRILYCDLQSLELALEYCDARYAREQALMEQEMKMRRNSANSLYREEMDQNNNIRRRNRDCAYLPLVRVALESDPDSDRGTAAAIQVLALRSGFIDRSAALRLLPHNVPVSAVARPFLIPALVDCESQVRRLTLASSLLRAKYVELKRALTDAQIKSQSSLHAVPALRSLNLGDVIQSSKPFKARPSHSASSTFPDVTIQKHFFRRHLVVQAKVTNSALSLDGRTLGDVAFVVAESSDEAILPTQQVPLKTLPPKSTGSAWCVLAASPQRLDGTAILTCELRYTVLSIDTTTGAPLSFGGAAATTGIGRTYVEELQDIEVRHAEFEL